MFIFYEFRPFFIDNARVIYRKNTVINPYPANVGNMVSS